MRGTVARCGRNIERANVDWYREVVQRCEGVWLHHAGRGWRGRLLPPHRDRGRGVSLAHRRTEGDLRGVEGSQGAAGAERKAGVATTASCRCDKPAISIA